jgi:hypothetical protein
MPRTDRVRSRRSASVAAGRRRARQFGKSKHTYLLAAGLPLADDARIMELSTLTSEQYRKLEAKELMHVLSAQAFGRREGGRTPADYYRERWGTNPTAPIVLRAFEWETKAAVAAGNTTDSAWAKPLVTSRLTDGYLALVRQASVLGQMPVTPGPFATPLPYQTGAASLKWVGEGAPKPVTKLALSSFTLLPTKGAGIIVLSKELMRFSMPGADAFVQTSLVNDLTAFVDTTLLSAAAATPESPAGILNGVTVSADIAATVAAFAASRPRALAPTWIVSAANLSKLTLDINGKLKNYPVVTSPNAGANLILVDAPALVVADDGVVLDTSDQASLQMDDAPTPATAATVAISLWAMNLVGLRVERIINWKVLPGAVQFTATLT